MKMKLVVLQIYWNQNNRFFLINWCGYFLLAITSSWIPKEVRLSIGVLFRLSRITHLYPQVASFYFIVKGLFSCPSFGDATMLFQVGGGMFILHFGKNKGIFDHLRGGTDFRILCASISFNFSYESTDRMSSMLTWNQRTFFLKKVKWGVCNKQIIKKFDLT